MQKELYQIERSEVSLNISEGAVTEVRRKHIVRRPRLPLLMGAHSARRDRDSGKFFGRISCFSLKNSRIVL